MARMDARMAMGSVMEEIKRGDETMVCVSFGGGQSWEVGVGGGGSPVSRN